MASFLQLVGNVLDQVDEGTGKGINTIRKDGVRGFVTPNKSRDADSTGVEPASKQSSAPGSDVDSNSETIDNEVLPTHSSAPISQDSRELLRQLQDYKEECEELRKVWNETRQSKEKAVSKLKQLLALKETELDECVAKMEEEHQTQLQQLRNEHQQAVLELKELNAKNQEEFDEALKMRDSYRSGQDMKVDYYEQLANEYRTEVKELTARAEAAEAERDEMLEAHRAQLKRIRDDWIQREKKLDQEKDIQRRELQALQSRETTVQHDTVEYVNAIAAAHKQIEDKAREVQEVVSQCRWLEAEKQTLLEQSGSLQRQLERVQQDKATADQRASQNIERLSKRNEDLSAQIHKSNKEISDMQTHILSLEKKLSVSPNDALQSRVRDADQRVKSMADQLMQKQSKIESISSERNALRLQLSNELNRVKSMESQITDLNRRLQKGLDGNYDYDSDDDLEAKIPGMRSRQRGRGRRRLFQTSNEAVDKAVGALDRVGIFIGVNLRRYPAVRLFFAVYALAIHLWLVFIMYHFAHHKLE